MSSKVPKFGAWEGGENYTDYFENARKTKNNGQTETRNRAELQGDQAKVPQFGAWDSGDNVGYTVYFENARKNKNSGPPMAENTEKPEPQGESKEPRSGGATMAKPEQRGGPTKEETSRDGRRTPGAHTPQHPRAGKSQLTPNNASRGSQTSGKGTAIPQFGVWNTNPDQAEDLTGTFLRARQDRNTPLGKNTPASDQQKTHQTKKTSCFPCFG